MVIILGILNGVVILITLKMSGLAHNQAIITGLVLISWQLLYNVLSAVSRSTDDSPPHK